MAIEIISTGMAAPERRVSNEELARSLRERSHIETSDEWIRSHTGIGCRHLASEGETCTDLAYRAAAAALEAGGVDPLSLDMIVTATATPEYYSFPGTSCLVQERLGARNAGAFDLGAGCTGFIYALEVAAGLLSVGESRKRALVIGAETLSRIVNWNDRSTCVLFGDGAGAVVLEKRPDGGARRGILRTILGADGSGAEALIIRRGGSKDPFRAGETISEPPCIEMNGQAVYNFAVKAVTDTIERLLAAEGIGVDALRWIIPHQANARIVSAAARRLKFDEAKFYLNIAEYANTSAASIPIALDELVRAGKVSRGDLIMQIGFGAGLTFGGNLIRW